MRVQSDQAHKLKEKSGDLKKKSKRLFDMEKSYKRQTQLIESRNRENKQLTDEVATLKARLVEREKVHQQNKDLVTKNCNQSSHIDRLKKQYDELKRKLDDANQQLRAQEMAQHKADLPPPRVYT